MTKPPIPDNLITDFVNSAFADTFDWSLLAMMLTNTALVALYVRSAMFFRGRHSSASRAPQSMDLAFGLAIAMPLAGLLVLGRSGLGWGLIIGGFALVIGLVLWGTARGTPSETSPAPMVRIR
ncbi:hypothetical protein ACIQC5_19850 [Paenarthrobacter sp. NPDC092416]|uniref:hypothetical protein n=1 Tax=Paenarthrobacter sp. NPDC092416 TaxID=3364386 RepID=UPI003816FBDE